MTILQVNTVSGIGSTGSIVEEIAIEAENRGHKCYIAYGQCDSKYHRSFKIGGYFENKVHGLIYSRILGLQGYGTLKGTKRLLKFIEEIKPDIIHLHNLHGNFLNHPLLFDYLIKNQIPIVFTLHDCYNFTGKCSHYTAEECYKWHTECNHCPLVHKTISNSWFFDCSCKMFNDKKEWYSNISKMTVIGVSHWIENEAKKSILAGNNHNVRCIYNWIDHRRFYRRPIDEISGVFNKYNLDFSFKYIVTVGAGWSNKTSKYDDAVRLSMILPKSYRLIVVGSLTKGTVFPDNIVHIPYVSSRDELACIYSSAYAYIHLSVEDTFGKVIAEAMACGTLPIVFDSTACPEVAAGYGTVVVPHDVQAIAEVLPSLYITAEIRTEMIDYVRKNYNYHKNIDQYLTLYEQL